MLVTSSFPVAAGSATLRFLLLLLDFLVTQLKFLTKKMNERKKVIEFERKF